MADEKTTSTGPQTAASSSASPSSSGLDPKLVGMLCWLFAPITSIIFVLMNDFKSDNFVQNHAKQSLVFGVLHMLSPFLMFLMFIPIIGWIIGCLGWLVSIAFLVMRIIFAVKAYNGETITLPLIGDMVK